jgi:hypothetical protein
MRRCQSNPHVRDPERRRGSMGRETVSVARDSEPGTEGRPVRKGAWGAGRGPRAEGGPGANLLKL